MNDQSLPAHYAAFYLAEVNNTRDIKRTTQQTVQITHLSIMTRALLTCLHQQNK